MGPADEPGAQFHFAPDTYGEMIRAEVPRYEELQRRIRTAVRTELSPRHVPDRIEAIAEVPRTLSGKKLEVPVKRVLSGVPLDKAVSEGALANPDAIRQVVALARE